MLQSFKMALKSIWGNKMRSFLTMLGIIIGVASVIILVGIVNGYMSYMTESFASMGVNQITVNYRSLPSRVMSFPVAGTCSIPIWLPARRWPWWEPMWRRSFLEARKKPWARK